ncbi:helix-turn-helix domain-containing protein [Amycolatopsis sp. NPDC051071]|uniref:helix-turn-helix domain-containing protein n=1 Tax=Amycolatopsis sp. NPDC051071 TaxID=3154637 RepID=UPI0034412E71
MTVSTLVGTTDRDVVLADKRDQRQAQELANLLPRRGARFTADTGGGDETIPVPVELSQIITQVVQAVALGQTVTVSSMPEELSTTAAAKLLGISRPTLMRMVNAGDIPARKVGSHTRLRTVDVLEEQRARRQRQIAAFDELRALEDD